MMSDFCGSRLFLSLPDDVFTVMSESLSPRDICSISLCCTSLNKTLASLEKVWLSQCQSLQILNSQEDLVEWRNGVSSYKCLFKFMFSVQPLLGIWVHQNPELGNVVYVMPGFLSVVGCRILPQEIGPSGILDGSLLWAPVFEIISEEDGELVFLLHGQDRDGEHLYPGSVKPIDGSCSILLLEVEREMQSNGCRLSLDANSSIVAFDRLTLEDRQTLHEFVTSQVGLKVPHLASGPLFPRSGDGLKKDLTLLSERRSLLLKMYLQGGGYTEPLSSTDALFRRDEIVHLAKDNLKPMLGKFTLTGGLMLLKNGCLSSEGKHSSQLHEFLLLADVIGLSLHASTLKQFTNKAWPKMHDDKYALYKLPTWISTSDQEYAGLWGGTFGRPPGRPGENKGKALFLLSLSYEESEGQQYLIATKILEGNHYVHHPNGSVMFTVKVNELSTDPFPLETDADFATLDIKHAYTGEGIADGYGCWYPGSKPGSLFVIQDGLLAFAWKESGAVLTLQRINLQQLLRKGERVPALPPMLNFTYLMKSYSNVFRSFSTSTSGL